MVHVSIKSTADMLSVNPQGACNCIFICHLGIFIGLHVVCNWSTLKPDKNSGTFINCRAKLNYTVILCYWIKCIGISDSDNDVIISVAL